MSDETQVQAEVGAAESEMDLVFDTANDRLKSSFSSWFWGSMVVATLAHFLALNYWPDLEAADLSMATMEEFEAVDIPPEIEIPPPPEAISRPANPVVTGAAIDDNITIAPTTFEQNLITELPPPPVQGVVNIEDQPMYTPRTVEPSPRDVSAVVAMLQREYPPMLRQAGVEGTVLLYLLINENGRVEQAQVAQSSGYSQFDEAALRVAPLIEFNPAMNREDRVRVWAQIPIGFAIQR